VEPFDDEVSPTTTDSSSDTEEDTPDENGELF
jgi:hypothetical protein